MDVVLIADSITTESVPHLLERSVAAQPDLVSAGRTGLDHSYSVDGMTGSCYDVGYLLALMMGDDSWAAQVHTITTNTTGDGEYFDLKVDRVNDLDTAKPTEDCIGCKIQSLTIEQAPREYAKIGFSGLFTKHGSEEAALSITIPTAADDQPLDYGGLSAAGAFVKLGTSPGGAVQMDEIESFKIDITREASYGGIQVSTEQPTAINEGGREIMVEIVKEFDVASAAEWAWFETDVDLEFDVRWDIGLNHLQIHIPTLQMVGSPLGEIGPGSDSIKYTFTLKAKGLTASIIDVEMREEGSVAALW